MNTKATRISSLIRDPALRAIFERAERDSPAPLVEWDNLDDQPAAADIVRPRILTGGAAERVRELEVV